MSNDSSFTFMKEEIDHLSEALKFRQGWIPANSDSHSHIENLIEKLKSKSDFINFVFLSSDEIVILIDAIDFRYEKELAEEDFEHLFTIKDKL